MLIASNILKSSLSAFHLPSLERQLQKMGIEYHQDDIDFFNGVKKLGKFREFDGLYVYVFKEEPKEHPKYDYRLALDDIVDIPVVEKAIQDIEKSDLQILDYFAEFAIPVSLLFSKDLDIALNKAHHNLNALTISAKLTKLCAHGMAEFVNYNQRLSIKITHQGLEYWENVFEFNWDKYFELRTEDFSETVTAYSLRTTNANNLKARLSEAEIAFNESDIRFIDGDTWYYHEHKELTESYLFAKILTHERNHGVPLPKYDFCLDWANIDPEKINSQNKDI